MGEGGKQMYLDKTGVSLNVEEKENENE
jgi:hypothetical protein